MPKAVITPSEITIYEGEVINLIVGEYQIYEWYNAEDDLLSVNSELSVTDSGSFYVFVIDENNCNDFSENAIVRTVRRTEIYIPSAFTPNGDDHNELFVIRGNYIVSYSMNIYNRWGEQLFVSNSIYKYWDGTFENNKVKQGNYFYVVEVIGEDGNLFKKTGLIEVLY
jgi:gliding motility-associated-like protein